MRVPVLIVFAGFTVLFTGATARAQAVRDLSGQASRAGQSALSRAPVVPRNEPLPPAPTLTATNAVGASATTATPAVDGLVVGAVLVEGAPEIAAATFMPAITPFIGRTLHTQDLQDLLSVISGVARAHGYALCHSMVPAQSFRAGVLKVSLDLGRIDRIDVHGDSHGAVQAVLATLIGKPARQDKVERQLMLASDLPGIVIGDVSYVREGDLGVLRVNVRHQPATVHVAIDNRGNSALGPVRLAMAYDLNDILGDERASASGQITVTPLHPAELLAASARLAYVIDDAGTDVEVSASVSHTHPGGQLASLGFAGLTREVAVAINHPLLRSRKSSLWLGADVTTQALDQWQGPIAIWRDRTTVLGLTLSGYLPLAKGRLRAGVAAHTLLDLPGLTEVGDPLASRPGAGGGARFINAWANWEGPLVGPFSARLAVSAQLADSPLPIAQQIAIGGPDFGRAYDYAERTGDSGAMGSMELRYQVPTRIVGPDVAMLLYGFADAGHVANQANAAGTGNLVSAGFGTRVTMPRNLRLGLELAVPANQPRFDTDSFAPRLTVNLGASF